MIETDMSLEAALNAVLLADAHALDSKDMQRWLDNYADEEKRVVFLPFGGKFRARTCPWLYVRRLPGEARGSRHFRK
ncbi:hypothetical protein [Sphingobium sp. Ant17]|uniref:hypothetical protein n=1 Tax=Sphingobium sp. Ant17 TaxID=1461752 RepID=UPI001F3CFCF3|nr:hypothetical protein [Sphingobium sp. Ant17]